MTVDLLSVERCTLTRAPRTVHLVEHRISWMAGAAAVRTWCGLTARAHAPTESAYRSCHRCIEAFNDHLLEAIAS